MSNELYLNDTQLQDPVNDIQDGLQDPIKTQKPGFFSTLKSPLELLFEESLPASLYQYATGNTKKKQAQEALKFLQNNPQLKNTNQYKEAFRIYQKFGYLLEEGEHSFDVKEIANMAKKYPGVIGAELVNMLVADPYLLLIPSATFSRLGRGVVNASRLRFSGKFKKLSKTLQKPIAKQAARDIKGGAMASVLLPFAFSTGLQLGEKGEIDLMRTTSETTFGATAGLILSTAFGGISALTSKSTYVPQSRLNNIIKNRIESYKSPDLAIDIVDGNYRVIKDVIEKDLKEVLKNMDPKVVEGIKAQISVGVRDIIENGRDSIKSSLVKAGTFGGIGATAQFLTEEDDKLYESLKGFGAGVVAYGLIKGAKKLFTNAKKLSDIELDAERTFAATKTQKFKIDSKAVEVASWMKNKLPDPKDRRAVFYHIQELPVDQNFNYVKGGKIIQTKDLTPDQIEFKNILKDYMDMMHTTLTKDLGDLNFQINYRSGYAPLIFQNFVSGTAPDFAEKFFGSSTKSARFFLKRKFDDLETAINAGAKLKDGMDDPAKLIQVYTFAASKALLNRNIFKYLMNKRHTLYKNEFGKPISYRIMYEFEHQIPSIFRNPSTKQNNGTYKPFRHPLLNKKQEFYVHQDLINSLNMMFDAATENEIMGALFNMNLMMKRSAVGFSFFHAGALIESMFFAGVPFKVIKEFIKPRSKNQIMNMVDNPNLTLKNFTYAKQASEDLGFGDVVSFSRSVGLEISTPEDVGYDRFYSILQKIDTDFFKPHFGISPAAKVEKVYKWFDRITWDRIFTQAKLYTFLKQMDDLTKGKTLTPLQLDDLARKAAQFTNDAFGGQNWQMITQQIADPTYKKLAQTLYKPGSRGYLQLLFFAPDWTISNLRIIGKALPGFTDDPVARRMYQYYFLRASLMYATIGTGLNYIFSGHSQLENKDPTRIDLGNGQVLTFSKQLMEPFHWITDPQGTGLKKIGSLPKGVIEVLTNKQYLTTKWSPNITSKDDTAIEKFQKIGGQVGAKFLPIWLQQASRQISERLETESGISPDLAMDVAVDFVLGQSGHPRYKGPRYTQYKLSGLARSPYEALF
jgi:hypothetical protein